MDVWARQGDISTVIPDCNAILIEFLTSFALMISDIKCDHMNLLLHFGKALKSWLVVRASCSIAIVEDQWQMVFLERGYLFYMSLPSK